MAFPFGAIGATTAVICSMSRKQHSYDYDRTVGKSHEYYEALKKKQNDIIEFLKHSFYIKDCFMEYSYDDTTYTLMFVNFYVGIHVSNSLMVDAPLDNLYRYVYGSVYQELMKVMENKYIQHDINNLEEGDKDE
jgi:hypothetical protein